MNHLIAPAIKLFMVAAVHVLIMNLFNNYPLGPTLALALLVTALSYLIGDLGILPMTNNTIATFADIGLATLTIWGLGPALVKAPLPFSIALIIGAVLGVGEWFFHKYMQESVMPRKDAI